MSTSIDLTHFRESPNFTEKQPLFPFVEVSIGGITVSDFNDDLSDTVIDFSYKRTAKQDVTITADNTFTLTLYDDAAIEIESILYSTLMKTAERTQEQLNEETKTEDKTGDNDTNTDDSNTNDTQTEGDTESIDITNEEENTDTDADNNSSGTQQELNISDTINNININYGWVDRNGNVVSEKKVNANFTKYSLEFEGASTILSLEGVSLDSSLLSSPSECVTKEYPASRWGGIASDIVKDVINSTNGLSYKDEDIEETEAILGEDGKPKSFIRNGETASVFIKNNLCEEAKSKKTGKVGYSFIVDNGKVSYKPSNISDKGVDVSGQTVANKEFSEEGTMDIEDTNTLGAGLSINTTDGRGLSYIQIAIEDAAELLAYEFGTDSSEFSIGNGSPKKEYKEVLDREFPNRGSWDLYDRLGTSCDVFVSAVIRESGYDKDFPYKYTRQLLELDSDEKWKTIEYSGTEKLYAGDVITYRNKKLRTRFIGIYIEQGGGRVACSMSGMAYGCVLGNDKLKGILNTDNNSITIYRVSGLDDKFYPDDSVR